LENEEKISRLKKLIGFRIDDKDDKEVRNIDIVVRCRRRYGGVGNEVTDMKFSGKDARMENGEMENGRKKRWRDICKW
jgi:hypothetical protein